jgi:exonuclease III
LNETRLKENQTLKTQSYDFVGKNRVGSGGGVSVLIKKGLEYEINNSFEKFNREIVSIKLKLLNTSLTIVSWYLPPDKTSNKSQNFIPEDFLLELNNYKPFVLCGDLNCHSTKWFCSNTTPKGKQFAEMIEKFDLNILNTKNY